MAYGLKACSCHPLKANISPDFICMEEPSICQKHSGLRVTGEAWVVGGTILHSFILYSVTCFIIADLND